MSDAKRLVTAFQSYERVTPVLPSDDAELETRLTRLVEFMNNDGPLWDAAVRTELEKLAMRGLSHNDLRNLADEAEIDLPLETIIDD